MPDVSAGDLEGLVELRRGQGGRVAGDGQLVMDLPREPHVLVLLLRKLPVGVEPGRASVQQPLNLVIEDLAGKQSSFEERAVGKAALRLGAEDGPFQGAFGAEPSGRGRSVELALKAGVALVDRDARASRDGSARMRASSARILLKRAGSLVESSSMRATMASLELL